MTQYLNQADERVEFNNIGSNNVIALCQKPYL